MDLGETKQNNNIQKFEKKVNKLIIIKSFALFDKTKKERTFKKISLPMTITVYFYFNQE